MVFTFEAHDGPATNSSRQASRQQAPAPASLQQPPMRSWAQMANKQQPKEAEKKPAARAAPAAQAKAPAAVEAFPKLGKPSSAANLRVQAAAPRDPFPPLGKPKPTAPKSQPLPTKGGLSAIFASESCNPSRAASRANSDTEGPAPKAAGANATEKKKKKRSQKNKNGNAAGSHKLLGTGGNGSTSGNQNTRSTAATAAVSAANVEALMAKHEMDSLSFEKRLVISDSKATSSASSEFGDSEVPTPLSSAEESSAGSTPVKRSHLTDLLRAHQAAQGDLVTVTSEDGKDIQTYEVALDHDFISRDVRSRPETRATSRERGSSSSRTTSNVSTPPRPITPNPGMAGRTRPTTPQMTISTKQSVCAADFEILRCLGKGAYGTVLLVRHLKTGKLYAQKQLKKASLVTTKKLVEQTLTERQILEAVRHPFVVKLYYAFQDHQKLYLILEYAEGGELFLHLATERIFPEETAAFYMASLVLALSHLHTNAGVVYRDLKPENCLLDREGYLLLTDFGLSKVATEESACRSWVGTVEYMAPEIILGKEYNEKVDWWSLGALGVDLLTGKPPFPGNNRAKVQENILKGKLTLPYYLSQDAKDILGKLLQKNPDKRWGVKDLERMKKHRFFRRVDWKRLEKRDVVNGPPIKPLVTDPEAAENFSTEFTELPCSPVVERGAGLMAKGREGSVGVNGIPYKKTDGVAVGVQDELEDELFGGFSFVGSYGLAVEMAHWASMDQGL